METPPDQTPDGGPGHGVKTIEQDGRIFVLGSHAHLLAYRKESNAEGAETQSAEEIKLLQVGRPSGDLLAFIDFLLWGKHG